MNLLRDPLLDLRTTCGTLQNSVGFDRRRWQSNRAITVRRISRHRFYQSLEGEWIRKFTKLEQNRIVPKQSQLNFDKINAGATGTTEIRLILRWRPQNVSPVPRRKSRELLLIGRATLSTPSIVLRSLQLPVPLGLERSVTRKRFSNGTVNTIVSQPQS